MDTVAVLLEVIDRASHANLLPVVERQIKPHFQGESVVFLEDRARREYLVEIEKRAKYEPRLRNILESRDWCIDCTAIN